VRGYEAKSIPVRTIPALSQWGLIALAGVLGILGLLAVRRKKAAAGTGPEITIDNVLKGSFGLARIVPHVISLIFIS